MIDWDRYARLLVEGSAAAIKTFLAQHPGIDLAAIGYAFELWNNSPAFELCANTHTHFIQVKVRYRRDWPNVHEETIRWSSGDFDYPANLTGSKNELGVAWESGYRQLHDFSNQKPDSRTVYDGLVLICCRTLAVLASRRIIPDWKQLDFNVAEYGDNDEVKKERDRMIHGLIESGC